MWQRQAVARAEARAYAGGDRAGKSRILDEPVELAECRRDYARAPLRDALKMKVLTPRTPRGPTYGPRIIAVLMTCWAVLQSPAGKLLAPMLPVLVPILCRDGERDLADHQAAQVCRMSAASIDRRMAARPAKMMPRGRWHTKPGSLLTSQIPVQTWADRDEVVPGFIEIDLRAAAPFP